MKFTKAAIDAIDTSVKIRTLPQRIEGEDACVREWTLRPAEPVRRWTVGDVTITKVSEGVLEAGLDMPSDAEGFLAHGTRQTLLDIDWLRPDFVTEEGAVRLAFHALVIETPTCRIVVDTCVGNHKDRPTHHFWQRLDLPFLRTLAEAGFDRNAVDMVVCTHLHVDHVGWNTMMVDGRWLPTFPNARYLLGRTEFAHCERRMAEPDDGRSFHPGVFLEDSIRPILDAGLGDLVESDHRLCDEVRLIPTAGHTPGHVSVVIESRGETALITGDTIHHPSQLRHPDWSIRADHDVAQAIETRRHLLERVADTGQLVIGTHWAGRSSGQVVREGGTFRLELPPT